MSELPPVQCFTSDTGVRIYRIPMLVFPNDFIGYAFVLLGIDVPTLVDTGSGFGQSTEDLLHGIEAIQTEFHEDFSVSDIGRIIVTHGHIDHFGGVADMLEYTGDAQVGIHRLDRRVLTSYEERVIVATKDLSIYLDRAGVRPDARDGLIEMYQFGKQHFRSVPVDFDLDEGTPVGGMDIIHTPGHCPGQVCMRVGDILLVGDLVLSRTTPHQSPESITNYVGLGHYADSLKKVSQIEGIRLALGGHEDPIPDLYSRIDAIQKSHTRKLDTIVKIMNDANSPMTISEISKTMYPNAREYHVLLAIEEVGAHIEYLYERGYLTIMNLHEFENDENPALLYQVIDE